MVELLRRETGVRGHPENESFAEESTPPSCKCPGRTTTSSSDQYASQFRVLGQREALAPCGGDHLETHVVGPGVVVLADAICDRGRIAPGDDRINEAVASASLDVLIAKAESAQVLRVIGEPEIQAGVLAGQRGQLDPEAVGVDLEPLVIGVGKGEHILASDPTAIMKHTKKVIYLEDYDMAVITGDKAQIHNLKDKKRPTQKAELLDYDNEQAVLGDFPNFMLKEIFEAPATIRSAILGRALADRNLIKLGGLESVLGQLKYIDRIVIVACGTSYYAGLVGEYLIEELAGIPVEVQLASEFKYRDEPFSRSTALLAISQSGETADTIAALKKVENYGVLRLGIVNSVGSTIARMTDAGVYCHAGPEQAVASTKAFLAQVTVLTLIALHLNDGQTKRFKPLLEELDDLPAKAQEVLDNADEIKRIAEKYANYRDFLYIGRNNAYPSAMEGALKLKECSYLHAEAYAAGEMKHGPLAMIDKDFPTFVIVTDSPLLEKTYSNIQEIRARGGPVVALATKGNTAIKELCDDVIYMPATPLETQPILHAIVTQLFAYYIAMSRGYDVDRPRNLAKSVTVE